MAESSDSPSSSTRVYTTRIEKQDNEPLRTERTVHRSSDKPDKSWGEKKDGFFKKFEDFGIKHKEKEKDHGGRVAKEKTTYDRGPGGRTVVTKTITTGDQGDDPRSYRREIRTTYTHDSDHDDDFGGRRGARKGFDDDDFFKKDGWSSKTRWEEKKDYSPKFSRSEIKPTTTGGGSAPKSSTPIDKAFKNQCIDSHNKSRAMHSAQPLRWSDDLARESQYYAEKLARQRTLQHSSKSDRSDAGENLAMFTGRYDTAGDMACEMWYEECSSYNFRRGGFQSGTGHFTQMVWKESKELGMGRAKTSDGRSTYVVARYRPAGNVVSYFAENVAPKRR